jgi:hypothetical protein
MSVATRRAAVVAALILVLPARADDAPKPGSSSNAPSGDPTLHPAGQVVGKLEKVPTDTKSTITVKTTDIIPVRNSRGRAYTARAQHKDHTYQLADDVKVRFHDLPKGLDGKAKQYTREEYQKLREPVGTPGYKAEMGDLQSGQTVRLYLARYSSADKPIVTTIMILPDNSTTNDAKTGK